MSFQNTFLIVLSIGTSTVLILLICYWLWRGLKSGVIGLFHWSFVTGRVSKSYRNENPVCYWLLFSVGLLLIPVILWLMFHRVDNLLHDISA